MLGIEHDGVVRAYPFDAVREAGGSCWKHGTGRATDGPHEGTRLARANDEQPMFWNGWSNFHPNTDVYGRD